MEISIIKISRSWDSLYDGNPFTDKTTYYLRILIKRVLNMVPPDLIGENSTHNLGNGLAPNGQQAINRTNNGSVLRCIYASQIQSINYDIISIKNTKIQSLY